MIGPVASVVARPAIRPAAIRPASCGLADRPFLAAAATATTPATTASATASLPARLVGGSRFTVRSRQGFITPGQSSLVDDVEFVIVGRTVIVCRGGITVSATADRITPHGITAHRIAATSITAHRPLAERLFATAGRVAEAGFATVFPLGRTFALAAAAASAPATTPPTAASFTRASLFAGWFIDALAEALTDRFEAD